MLDSMVEEMLVLAKDQEAAVDRWLESHQESTEREWLCDEIAFLFCHRDALQFFINDCVRSQQWALTNIADDTVHTTPIRSTYEVTYHFLTDPKEEENFRIECMSIVDGFSPLHGAIGAAAHLDGRAWNAVHASFKVPGGVDEYEACMARLGALGCTPVLHCASTYGKFSYWTVPDNGEGIELYLKPRINLRDAS